MIYSLAVVTDQWEVWGCFIFNWQYHVISTQHTGSHRNVDGEFLRNI